jgi:hypothetical protein
VKWDLANKEKEEAYLDPEHNVLTSGELHAFQASAEEQLNSYSTLDLAGQEKLDVQEIIRH